MMKKIGVILFFLISVFTVEANENDVIKIAVFGTGKILGQPEKYDLESLAKILKQIKTDEPDAVIFTGHLIIGLEQKTSQESLLNLQAHFRTFSSLVEQHLGKEIPLYPIMGNHTFVNTQAVSLFKNHFKVENVAPLEPSQLAYSVTIDTVRISLLATGDFERKFRGFRKFSQTMPILDWLEKDVRTGGDEIDFHFVIGHEPAYYEESAEGLFFGEKPETKKRDHFWEILKNNKVRGYLCSHELMYDRSNRDGVWQIISGGVGDPSQFPDEASMFRHYVLLTIPKNGSENPVAKAIDVNNKTWDTFEMVPVDKPVRHLRISQI